MPYSSGNIGLQILVHKIAGGNGLVEIERVTRSVDGAEIGAGVSEANISVGGWYGNRLGDYNQAYILHP